MSEIIRPRLSEDAMREQIETVKKIADYTLSIKNLTAMLKGKSVKIAFENSVINLEKKCELYGKEKITLSPDEKKVMHDAAKQALENFRAQKKNDEVSATTDNTAEINESITEISEAEVSEVKQHENKKKGRR